MNRIKIINRDGIYPRVILNGIELEGIKGVSVDLVRGKDKELERTDVSITLTAKDIEVFNEPSNNA